MQGGLCVGGGGGGVAKLVSYEWLVAKAGGGSLRVSTHITAGKPQFSGNWEQVHSSRWKETLTLSRWRSVLYKSGSGSADPFIFIIDLQDAKKKLI